MMNDLVTEEALFYNASFEFLPNYQIFVTRQEIGEKKRIREIGLRWDIYSKEPQMYY